MATQDKIESIQVLRFIAALTVIFAHLPGSQFMAWGVDIFFVLSGFVIAYTSAKSSEFFFIKRLIRIVPIYWILTLSLFALGFIAPNLLNSTEANFTHLLKSLFFIPFDKNGIGHKPILAPGWTINYEMLFYTLFALAMFLSRKQTILIASSLLFSLVLLSPLMPMSEFYKGVFGNSMLMEFIFGMFIWKFWFANYDALHRYNAHIVAACSLIILSGFFLQTGVQAVDVGLPSAALVLASMIALPAVPMPGILSRLGDASYSLYLIHLYVIMFFERILHLFDQGPLVYIISSVLCIVIACITALLSFKYIEKPINKYLRDKLCSRPSSPADLRTTAKI